MPLSTTDGTSYVPIVPVEWDSIRDRLGEERFHRRLFLQDQLLRKRVWQGRGYFRLRRWIPTELIVKRILGFTGLYRRGLRNFRDITVVEHEVYLEHLPSAFEGFRLLQISDLHIDLDPDLVSIILEKLDGLDYDQAVITGDYCNATDVYDDDAISLVEAIVAKLKKPVYGILGNHDLLEIVASLEAMELNILLNEVVPLERGGSQVYLAGIDDPHFYGTHDIQKVSAEIPNGVCRILLSHSPETFDQAAHHGFHFVLSGHTHGGQICLPGNIAIVRNGECPRFMDAGPWEYNGMIGYTSRGTGGSGVAVRYYCPPEITIHVLRGRM